MRQQNQVIAREHESAVNKIIEKLYGEEPGLILPEPVMTKQKRGMMARIWERVWIKRSRVTKTLVIALFFLLATGSVLYYNRFITELYDVDLEKAQLVAEVQRKNLLIPGLAKVVEDYLKYEGKMFVHAADVRIALEPFKKQAPGQMDTETFARFKNAISEFQTVAESYPQLKSSEAYQKLMLELANTETRMANARNSYSISVNRYNTAISLLPGCVFGYVLGFKPAKEFVAEKRNSNLL